MLIDTLARRGIEIACKGDRLYYMAPPGALTEAVLAEMRLHRRALLRHLQGDDMAMSVEALTEAEMACDLARLADLLARPHLWRSERQLAQELADHLGIRLQWYRVSLNHLDTEEEVSFAELQYLLPWLE